MSEEEQLVFLDFLQREKNADPAQVKLYMERADRAEKEKLQLREEKNKIESDLELLRANRDDDIEKIIEESKERENQIREEIAKAEKDKNEKRIISLQQELADEKESASRMIKDTNNRLEKAQGELLKANQRIQELESQETGTEMEELYRVCAELDMNLTFLKNLCSKTLQTLDNYKVLADTKDIETVMISFGNIKELKAAENWIKNYDK